MTLETIAPISDNPIVILSAGDLPIDDVYELHHVMGHDPRKDVAMTGQHPPPEVTIRPYSAPRIYDVVVMRRSEPLHRIPARLR
jgi:hypothetical protein